MGLLRARALRWLIPLTALAAVVALHPAWLRLLGAWLLKGEEPFRAEAVVVLAGDGYGHRIRTAAELVRQGYAPKVLVSGPDGLYGYHECDLAIPYATKLGYPAAWFVPLPNSANSTRAEARALLAECRRRNIRKFMVVTSTYHTRRAGSIFRWLAPEAELRVVAAPDPLFDPRSWWRTRAGLKIVLLEWEKTIAGWLGI